MAKTQFLSFCLYFMNTYKKITISIFKLSENIVFLSQSRKRKFVFPGNKKEFSNSLFRISEDKEQKSTIKNISKFIHRQNKVFINSFRFYFFFQANDKKIFFSVLWPCKICIWILLLFGNSFLCTVAIWKHPKKSQSKSIWEKTWLLALKKSNGKKSWTCVQQII